MNRIGEELLSAEPPIRALYVYNSNPAAVAPSGGKVRRGLEREDLFTVVHELFQTDTADFADIVLPATTTLEMYDIHKAYGHLYLSLNRPAIAPLGDPWPASFRPDFTDVEVGIARTQPRYNGTKGVHEVEALFLDSINRF